MPYEKIQEITAKHGFANPGEMIIPFLEMLRSDQTLGSGGTPRPFHDGLDSLTGDHANSIAESICNLARVTAAAHAHNARNASSRDPEQARTLAFYASRLQALCEILDYFIPAWNAQGKMGAERVRDIVKKSRKQNEGGGQ
jgi:hypothetical protein